MGKAVQTVVDELPEKWSLFYYHEDRDYPAAEICEDRFWFAPSKDERFEMTYQEALDSPEDFVRFVQRVFPFVARGELADNFFHCLFNWSDKWAQRVHDRTLLGLVLETHPQLFKL